MKKLFLSLATVGLLFTACDKDKNKNDGTNKLPSKMTTVYTYSNGDEPEEYFVAFEYDGQNRMTKLTWDDGSYDEFSYNADNTLSKCFEYDAWDTTYCQREFIYSGNLMFIKWSNWYSQGEPITWNETMDTVTLENGRMTKWISRYGDIETFTYNSNGNITRSEYQYYGNSYYTDYEYTDIPSIFRHANVPDWVFWWEIGAELSKSGYMLKKITDDDGDITEYAYETNGDYVSKRTSTFSWEEETPDASNASKRKAARAKQRAKRLAASVTVTGTETVTYEYIDAK
ncbi:MAG: hypothetical protein LBU91_04620 [Bacteroidales bacterium]|jgi:hypothetical protein|nr:hypothetical protein [Bacteroidales bacterium]